MKSRIVLPLVALAVSGGASMALAQAPGTFTATGGMTMPRAEHTATLLLDGRVLIAGGSPASANPLFPVASAELYDPSTGAFTATGDMTTARFMHTATLLPDGRVLIAGGNGGETSAELYDPSTGTFTATSTMTTSHDSATLLNSGKVLLTGITGSPATGASAELYDPSTGAFTVTGEYAATSAYGPAGPFWATATLLPDGRVLIAAEPTAELYDPRAGTFGLTDAMPARDGYPYITSGTATLLTNGKVLLAGGVDEDFRFASAELYDSSTGIFTATGSMPTARSAHTATLLPDGRVLIAGGGIEESPPYGTYASAEFYDPSTGAFYATGSMTTRRSFHTATLLKDGRVLMTGGVFWLTTPAPPTGVLSSAELYTPSVLAPAPVLFSLSGDGRGPGAIWHAQTGQIASAGNPAVAGEALSMYTAGLADGGVVPPQVVIGGQVAEILFFGDAPGYPGFSQVNFRVASGVAPGPAVPVHLTYLGRPSNAVTIGVQ